jgi:serine/threonine-protein kinase
MLPPLAINTILQNRYRLLSILGQGGFGRTYLAADQGRFNEQCAIKELILAQSDTYVMEKSRELFQREAAVLYQIQHPQIPQFRANFEQDQRLFLVQDYVEGKTYHALLSQRLAASPYGNGGFSEAEVLQLMQQLLPVLAYIHSKGIIHRDISPGNLIRRDQDQLPVLIDFGVVKEVASRVQPTYVDRATAVGKIGYAPMEQIQTGQAYPNSDLYSLAVTMIVLLTGREPQQLFDDRTMTWFWQTLVPVSPGFAQVLNRMLNYKPGDRYQSAQEVLQALQSMGSQPVVYPPTQAPAYPSTYPQSPPATYPQQQVPSYAQSAQPPNQPVIPPPTQAATIAVGRRPEATTYGKSSPQQFQSRDEGGGGILDNPLGIGAIGAGIAFAAGFGSWAVVNYVNSRPQPVPSPSPTIVLPSPLTPSPTASATPSPSPVTINQALTLQPNQPQQVEGSLRASQTLNYQVTGKQGQIFSATLASRSSLMSILSPKGEPIDDAASDTRSWKGELPADGTYTVRLSLLPNQTSGNFKLSLTLNDAPAKESPSPSPSVAPPSPTEPAAGLQTQRVNIVPGGDSTEIIDVATPNTTLRYLVNVRQGQVLDAIVVSGLVTITVRYPDGTAVEDASGLVQWQGETSLSGDYQIDVVAIEPTNFVVRVGVR